ncbi:MAG TPA: hypothetical protein VFP50_07650 [Anaeromyxobacteraceae bacterium]|nr:hypothetical protein [Anaeromyxobacteraceae bacterium]
MTRRALLLAALALAGCGAIQGVRSRLPPRAPQPGPDAGEWGALRDGASRQAKLYDGFVHRATASATWLSPPVREAASRRLAEWQAWPPADLEAALAAGRADAAQGEEFVVAFYTADKKDNDLDARPSVWHVEIDDGAARAPAAAVTAERSDATLRQLFPYVGPFDTVYRIRIPWTGAPLAGRPFVLRIAGALGAMGLDFGAQGAPPERPHQAP